MEYVILIVALAVLALVVGGLLLVRPRRTTRLPSAPPERPAASGEGSTAVLEREPAAPTLERAPPAEPAAPPKPEIEIPPPSAGRLVRLRARLARSQNALGHVLLGLLSRDTLDEDAWDEIEDTLISADIGVAVAREITEALRTRVQVMGARTPEEVRALLRDELLRQVTNGFDEKTDRRLRTARHGDRPAVVMVVGVNGTGKTTTCGKLARVLVGDGNTVLLGAADTFRAAAADQLETWGKRVGAEVVRKGEGADPGSVAFDAVRQGIEGKVDTVIIDTAGRLHTKTGLMDELGKVKRVVEKQATVDEVLLVLDATTGQNGMQQARVFAEVVNVTGIVLTKLDGTAKGGIVIAVQRELGVPVKLVGLGEGPDDLAPFEAEPFVDAIIGE